MHGIWSSGCAGQPGKFYRSGPLKIAGKGNTDSLLGAKYLFLIDGGLMLKSPLQRVYFH